MDNDVIGSIDIFISFSCLTDSLDLDLLVLRTPSLKLFDLYMLLFIRSSSGSLNRYVFLTYTIPSLDFCLSAKFKNSA
jgi:hypothetical protein